MATNKQKRWSQRVTQESNALDLEQGVFSKDNPRSIARSLKRSADRSKRRKADPFRSAMSMLTFYINRAGKTLSKSRRKRLEAAKKELTEHPAGSLAVGCSGSHTWVQAARIPQRASSCARARSSTYMSTAELTSLRCLGA